MQLLYLWKVVIVKKYFREPKPDYSPLNFLNNYNDWQMSARLPLIGVQRPSTKHDKKYIYNKFLENPSFSPKKMFKEIKDHFVKIRKLWKTLKWEEGEINGSYSSSSNNSGSSSSSNRLCQDFCLLPLKVALFIFPSFRLNDNGVIKKRRNSSWNSYLVTVYAPHELWTVSGQ